ncbi:hypothetical protein FP744_10001445 [Trichoderma asperellum]|nr:hypothetical protein LI328DRAFT_126353 [Trichoderma asperelloides]
MTKRKSDTGPVLPRKRAKLTQLLDPSEPQSCDVFLAPSQPPSPPMPPRLERRKRNRAGTSQTDSDEEPGAKRARTNHSSGNLARGSRSSSPEVWPSIGYEPEQEKKPNPRAEAFQRAWTDVELVCSCQPQTVYRNPLPSPVPSDRDASEPDGDEFAAISATSLPQHSNIIPQPSPSPKLQQTILHGPSPFGRKRRISRRQSTIPTPASSRGKESQRQPRQKKHSRKDQPQENNDPPLIETILHSRRSSRRSPGCELWYLNDNGIACAVMDSR